MRQKEMPWWLDWILWIIGGVLVALLLRAFVIGVYLIPSGSMLETIAVGDRVVGEKISYLVASPAVGDIVTFDDPDGSGETLIKRVIAVGGQTVDLRDGVVYVDGEALDEPYTQGRPSYELSMHSGNLTESVSYPYAIPAGELWVMGDNRTNSADSRYFGSISEESVSSRALFVYWPLSDIRTL